MENDYNNEIVENFTTEELNSIVKKIRAMLVGLNLQTVKCILSKMQYYIEQDTFIPPDPKDNLDRYTENDEFDFINGYSRFF